ncbi:2-methylcitrate dehydratase [Glonium stellatum]|uniref:2-methylcitrate dehydratase n=1 Tax=Glonium stellatum TaxID=574774 RepID=A0A8E2FA18_9PEZI|nr:2-methylcitrate dehydratase [Glonium stellatum]
MAIKVDTDQGRNYDSILLDIINYVYGYKIQSPTAFRNAKAALLDALGCAFESLQESKELCCMIGPVWAGADIAPDGFKLPGTGYQLDPLKGAFDLGSMIRYLDHNDAFPGAEWGHPSDNIGAILVIAISDMAPPSTLETVLTAMIKAYEIQGCFQIKNAFNKVGLDHTILVKIASTAVVCWMLGLTTDQALSALSHAWMDGHPLRVYRQSPNAGPRKGWAAGDACMRAVHIAFLAGAGQPGAPTVLTQPKWGFYNSLFRGQTFDLPRPFGSWTMENIIFKVHTAEGHGMSAVEAAVATSNKMQRRGIVIEDISHVRIRTQEAGMIIINKPLETLSNAADRDHCMQYMVAVCLIKGAMIETADYQNDSPWANDERVETLRAKIEMVEDPQYTADYHDPLVRSCANAVLVTLKDGTELPEAVVDYPLGHPKRNETVSAVRGKARRNLSLKLPQERVGLIMDTSEDSSFLQMPVTDFVDMFIP